MYAPSSTQTPLARGFAIRSTTALATRPSRRSRSGVPWSRRPSTRHKLYTPGLVHHGRPRKSHPRDATNWTLEIRAGEEIQWATLKIIRVPPARTSGDSCNRNADFRRGKESAGFRVALPEAAAQATGGGVGSQLACLHREGYREKCGKRLGSHRPIRTGGIKRRSDFGDSPSPR